MFIVFEDRPSDSPLVEKIWRCHSERAGLFHSVAACHWEMVVNRLEGRLSLTVRGPETRGTLADCPAEGEWMAIRFKLGTYMPTLHPGRLRDRQDVNLPAANRRSFWLEGSAWEYPNFENAETFVQHLVRQGLVKVDCAVEAEAQGERTRLHPRTAQRRFLQVTGVTQTTIHQIERARQATRLLQRGVAILDVVHLAGYYDQAHLTRALKRFTGLTPAQILRAQQQLSFLYNTELE